MTYNFFFKSQFQKYLLILKYSILSIFFLNIFAMKPFKILETSKTSKFHKLNYWFCNLNKLILRYFFHNLFIY